MLEYKSPICIRGTHLNCPLPLTLESYWACEANCLHCMGRRLNQIWGEEQRITDPEKVRQKLIQSQKNNNPKSPLAVALKLKKVFWLGRKSDPYQPIELEQGVTRSLVSTLIDMEWPFIICSRYIQNAMRDEDQFIRGKSWLTFLVELTPGGEQDWEFFEFGRTTPPLKRLQIARRWASQGIRVGVRGEPFIPGYHTTAQFRDTLRLIKSFGMTSYNTYNLHMNEYTLKRFHEIGLDIERIWEYNQDGLWRPIQQELCSIADEEGITLGCPDFVNTHPAWKSQTNTCCGVNIENAFTFNTHVWRQEIQAGKDKKQILGSTWEGIGTPEDQNIAESIVCGKTKELYTMEDAGL